MVILHQLLYISLTAVSFILICGKAEHLFKCYICFLFIELSPNLSQAPSGEPEPEPEHPFITDPVLDAPVFPDFETSEMETGEGEAVDIAALELEALDLVSTDLPAPFDFEVIDGESPQPDLSACDLSEASMSSIIQDLNLGSQNIIPLDPANFPEPINLSEFPDPAVPEQWSQSEEALVDCFPNSQSDETDLGAAECQSVPEETELSNHASLNDGNQTQSR